MAGFTRPETTWLTWPGGQGRSPGLENLLSILILLTVVRAPDVRSGGTGRLQAGLVGKLPICPFRLVERHTKGRGPGESDVLP